MPRRVSVELSDWTGLRVPDLWLGHGPGNIPSIMSEASLSGDWFPLETAPRDGTPMILWMAEDQAPPALPVTVGFWTIHRQAGVGYSQIFGITRAFAPTDRSTDGSHFFRIIEQVDVTGQGTARRESFVAP